MVSTVATVSAPASMAEGSKRKGGAPPLYLSTGKSPDSVIYGFCPLCKDSGEVDVDRRGRLKRCGFVRKHTHLNVSLKLFGQYTSEEILLQAPPISKGCIRITRALPGLR